MIAIIWTLLLGLGAASLEPAPLPWGAEGHEMAARIAARKLPAEMPPFFRASADQLAYLNPEPDRWRDFQRRAMDEAYKYDHYIDLENVPDGALEAPDRFSYLRALYEAGLERPERDAGFLPYRILELYQRLVTQWTLWTQAPPERRRWIEERIIHDAGVLGHYVTDASQPHHTTIHFNGWNDRTALGAPVANPQGYTTDNTFHRRFESDFVSAHLREEQVAAEATAPVRDVSADPWAAVMAHIQASHAQVETLYRLDRDYGFHADAPASDETLGFAAERLASGAEMLADLWWSAYLEGTATAGLREGG